MYHRCESCSSYSTSASDSAVLHTGHQLIMRSPRYIRPFSYSRTNTSFTARLQPSSIVKRSRLQSHDAPSLRCCSVMRPAYLRFQSQARFKNSSRPICCLVRPSALS